MPPGFMEIRPYIGFQKRNLRAPVVENLLTTRVTKVHEGKKSFRDTFTR